jgi:hypothetical protein
MGLEEGVSYRIRQARYILLDHDEGGAMGRPQGVFAFLALAHHRLGHRDEAERWLDKLVAHRPKEGFDFSTVDAEIRILHREAESPEQVRLWRTVRQSRKVQLACHAPEFRRG